MTQAIPLAEILVHRVTRAHHMSFGTGYDIDLLRQMHEEEEDHDTMEEIVERMSRAGCKNIVKKRFATRWGLNCLYSGWKV